MEENKELLKNNKDNYVKNLNASNEAKRLENQVKAYNNSIKNSSSSNNFNTNKNNTNNTSNGASVVSSKRRPHKNSRAINQIAKKGVSAVGVPKPIADKLVDSKLGQKAISSLKRKSPMLNMFDNILGGGKKEREEQFSDSGGQNFKIPAKVIKWALIASPPILTIVIFSVLFISASQIYINSIGLGSADSVSGTDAESKINENINKDDKLNTEIKDNTAYIINDSSLTFMNSKLNKVNLIQVDNEVYDLNREFNEADLRELNDYYSDISSYESDGYDMNVVYKFFFKLYYIQRYYRNNYNVYLDMPLIMATLRVQSSDMGVVFSSNTEGYDVNLKENNPLFSYDDNTWEGYITSSTKSDHDIEVLAQRMTSRQVEEACVNSSGNKTQTNILKDDQIGTQTLTCKEGESYQTTDKGLVKDEEKYKEFLKEFIEKKYFEENVPISANTTVKPSTGNNNGPVCGGEDGFEKYSLTEDQLIQIASLCQREQGSPKGAAAEASLMANRFELYGSSFGTGADGLYKYVRNSGWFASSKKYMDNRDARQDIIAAVRSVLVEGKRTLPGYVDEHDCISCSKGGAGDIGSVTNNGAQITKTDKSSYIQFTSIIKNIYGSTYTFYSFPTESSDPFGYTRESNREKIGDFYYDFDSGQPVNCEIPYTPNISDGDWKNWHQCGESWSNIQLPNTSSKDSTICKYGCLSVAISIQIARSGTATTVSPFNPGTAIPKYKFNSGGIFATNGQISVAPNFVRVASISTNGMSNSAAIEKMMSYDPNKYYLVLGVGRGTCTATHGGGIPHWVALDYVDPATGKVYIMDPGEADEDELFPAFKLCAIQVYEKKD